MPETAGTASNGEHLEDSAPLPETGTHGADGGEEAKDAINESDGPSLLDMDAPTRRRWVEALLQLPDVDGEALDRALTDDTYDAATLKKVRAAVRGAQSKLKARRGNLVTRVAGRVVSRPSSTGRAGRVRSFLRACDAAGL